MTAQMGDLFEYEDQIYFLMGWTGGPLVTAEDFGMEFEGGSTANYRGYRIVYGIDSSERFVAKRLEVMSREVTPVKHNYIP